MPAVRAFGFFRKIAVSLCSGVLLQVLLYPDNNLTYGICCMNMEFQGKSLEFVLKFQVICLHCNDLALFLATLFM